MIAWKGFGGERKSSEKLQNKLAAEKEHCEAIGKEITYLIRFSVQRSSGMIEGMFMDALILLVDALPLEPSRD